jgi:hypothetical protein
MSGYYGHPLPGEPGFDSKLHTWPDTVDFRGPNGRMRRVVEDETKRHYWIASYDADGKLVKLKAPYFWRTPEEIAERRVAAKERLKKRSDDHLREWLRRKGAYRHLDLSRTPPSKRKKKK